MKKILASLVLALFATACTEANSQNSMMQSGKMCEKCTCCQKMMDGNMGMMNDGKMQQCQMMKGSAKDGKQVSCCQMMDGEMMNQTAIPAAKAATSSSKTKDAEHKEHHPEK